jgi:hypothetical protein
MRRFAPALVVASIFLSSLGTLGQKAGPMHAPDFRAQEHIAPLYFPPKPNAPFMAIAKTEWVRTLPDGSTLTRQNARVVARDMDGRVFQERRTFVPVPDTGKEESQVYATEYLDPVEHTLYRCNPFRKECNLFEYRDPSAGQLAPAGLQPNRTSYLTREDLGVDTFAGLDVQRSRETLTLYAESIGNTKTILRSSDFWYSPALGINVQVKRHDPRDGDQTLWLSEVTLTAAAPETFKVPAAYRIVDHRAAEQAPAPSLIEK